MNFRWIVAIQPGVQGFFPIIRWLNCRNGIMPAHPTVQVNISTAFAAKWLERGNRFLVLTYRADGHATKPVGAWPEPASWSRGGGSFRPRQTLTLGQCVPGFYRPESPHPRPAIRLHCQHLNSYQ